METLPPPARHARLERLLRRMVNGAMFPKGHTHTPDLAADLRLADACGLIRWSRERATPEPTPAGLQWLADQPLTEDSK